MGISCVILSPLCGPYRRGERRRTALPCATLPLPARTRCSSWPSLAQTCESVGINPMETPDVAASSPVPLLSFLRKKSRDGGEQRSRRRGEKGACRARRRRHIPPQPSLQVPQQLRRLPHVPVCGGAVDCEGADPRTMVTPACGASSTR
jgi:hypothetical protein